MRDIYELISGKLDGALDKDGEAELELRLSSDPEARELYRLLSSAHETLNFEVEPPRELLQGVMEGVERINRERRSARRRVIRMAAGFAAAAAVLAVAIVPAALRDRSSGISPYSGNPDLAREYHGTDNATDGSTDPAPCSTTEGDEPVFVVPPDDHFTAETFCADYYAVLYFDEIPEALKGSVPVAFSDGTVGYVITKDQFEAYRDAADKTVFPNPDGALFMAVDTAE